MSRSSLWHSGRRSFEVE